MRSEKVFKLYSRGKDVSEIQEQLVGMGYQVPAWELREGIFGPGTRSAWIALRACGKLGLNVSQVTARSAILSEASPAVGIIGKAEKTTATKNLSVNRGRIDGRLAFRDGLVPEGVVVRAYHKGVGSRDVLLAQAETGNNGAYALEYDIPQHAVNLELRVVGEKGLEIALHGVVTNAAISLTKNCLVPDGVKRPACEYRRLMQALKAQGITLVRLASLRENGHHQEISVLRAATGWDARLIAMAVIAARKAIQYRVRHDVLYALVRMGLPHDVQLLVTIGEDEIEAALARAREAEIVDISDEVIANAKYGYQMFANNYNLNTLRYGISPGAMTSLDKLLGKSGLVDPEQLEIYVSTYHDYLKTAGQTTSFWDLLITQKKKNGLLAFDVNEIAPLKRHAQLSRMTLNHAGLVNVINQDLLPEDEIWKLVDLDLYKPENWESRLKSLAGWDENAEEEDNYSRIEREIPPFYSDVKIENRLEAYCQDLADTVASEHSTRVVAHLIGSGEGSINVGDSDTNEAVRNFLVAQAESDGNFNLATSRIGTDLLADEDVRRSPVLKLQRLYRISPSDTALSALWAAGFDSAHDVARIPLGRFLEEHGSRFSSETEARLVHQASCKVDAVSLVIAQSLTQLNDQTIPYAMRDIQIDQIREEIKPILQGGGSLIGAGDYCTCEHCRSVLSPAAYFVDILDMLDSARVESESLSLLEILSERRPDLKNLPLTCENTNTSMPYIDIVNEILEFIVANGGVLEESAARDTGGASSEDLLAEPQNTNRAAYEILNGANSRVGLPFNLSTEMLRRFSERFDAPLWKLKDVFRIGEGLSLRQLTVCVASAENVVISGAPATIDDVTLEEGDRVLLWGQTDPKENGVYVFSEVGNPMVRASEADSPEDLKELCVTATDENANPVETWVIKNKDIDFNGSTCVTPLVFARTNTTGHGRAAVFAEFLGLNPAEERLFSDNYAIANKWGALYGYSNDSEALGALTGEGGTKILADCLGVNYTELSAVVNTSFVNPHRSSLQVLEELNRQASDQSQIDLETARLVVDQLGAGNHGSQIETLAADFLDRLAALFGEWGGFEPQSWLIQFKQILYFKPDGDTSCRFGLAKLCHLNGANSEASGFEFLKINLFVRLWKKLGWTIEETDRALVTFIDSETDAAHIGEALGTALIYIAHMKNLNGRLKLKKNGILKLATFWSDIAVPGHTRLYCELFNLHTVPNQESVFDSPLGRFLERDGSGTLEEHFEELQGALGLSRDDILRVIAEENLAEPYLLTLAVVSTLYRYGILAKGLALSIREIIALKNLSGLSPFKPLADGSIANIDQDYPFIETLCFVEFAERIQESPIDLEDLDYLVRHQFDSVGKYRDEAETTREFFAMLRSGLEEIEEECAIKAESDDAGDVSIPEAYFSEKLGLVLEDSVVKAFAGRWVATAKYVAQTVVPEDYDNTVDVADGDQTYSRLNEADFADQSDIDLKWTVGTPNVQRLVLHGVPTPERLTALLGKISQSDPEVQAKEAALFTQLWADLQIIHLDSSEFVADGDFSVYWDESTVTQRVAFLGILTDAKKAVFLTSENHPSLATRERRNLLGKLLDEIQRQVRSWGLEPSSYSMTYEMDQHDLEAGEEPVDVADLVNEPNIELVSQMAGENVIAQALIYHGVISSMKLDQLQEDYAGGAALNWFSLELAKVRDRQLADFTTFYEQCLVHDGFLEADRFHKIMLPAVGELPDGSDIGEFDNEYDRRTKILEPMLAQVQQKLTRAFLTDQLARDRNADPGIVEYIMDVLPLGASQGTRLSDAFASASTQGVTATYHYDTGAKIEMTQSELSTANLPMPPEGASQLTKVEFEGCLQVENSGTYQFRVVFDDTTEATSATLNVDLPGELRTHSWQSDPAPDLSVELKKGLMYHFSFDVVSAEGATSFGTAVLYVAPEKSFLAPAHYLTMSPQSVVDDVHKKLLLFRKAVQIPQALSLSSAEYRYFLENSGDFGGFDPSLLATETTTESSPLQAQLMRLDCYRKLKSDLAGETEDLIEAFALARAVEGDEVRWSALLDRLAEITRRGESGAATIEKTLRAMGFEQPIDAAPWLVNEQGVGRLWDALQVVEKFGVEPEVLAACVTNNGFDQSYDNAQSLRNAFKSRFASDEWRLIAQPIFDELRRLQRDALVAYLLHLKGLDNVGKLYELLLVDPGMEPVVQTSRLRLAISSAQLFVQRCLLGLEAEEHEDAQPSAVDKERWEWMKRYRVWEANRKTFLYPENWLEPEFRDDKSHLYQELESTLLGGEVTDEKAREAYGAYLSGLATIARLEIMTFCTQEVESSYSNRRVLHVVGRTYSSPHKYYYRRLQDGVWTPWIPVDAEIDSDLLAAAFWQGRFHLFWVTLNSQPTKNGSSRGAGGNGAVEIADSGTTYIGNLSWCSYNNGRWSDVSTGGTAGSIVYSKLRFAQLVVPAKKLRVTIQDEGDGINSTLQINLVGGFLKGFFKLSGQNNFVVASPPSNDTGLPVAPALLDKWDAYKRSNGSLKVLVYDPNSATYWSPRIILSNCDADDDKSDFRPVCESANTEDHNGSFRLGEFERPFFFQDKTNTFLGIPELQKVEIEVLTGGFNVDHSTDAEWGGTRVAPGDHDRGLDERIEGQDYETNVIVGNLDNMNLDDDVESDGFRTDLNRFLELLGSPTSLLDFREAMEGVFVQFDNALVGPNGRDNNLVFSESPSIIRALDALARSGELTAVTRSAGSPLNAGRVYSRGGSFPSDVTIMGPGGITK